MSKSHLNEFLTHQVLTFKLGSAQEDFLEGVLEHLGEGDKTKNICAKVSVSLAERIDEAVGTMNCSKRQFLETAFIGALDEYDSLIEEYDMFGPHLVKEKSE